MTVPGTNIFSAEHEALCKKCGKCCRKKAIIGGRVVYMPGYCRHFDEKTRLCKVYEMRLTVHPGCKTMPEAIRMGILPADCAYVQGIEGYVPPIEDWNSPEADKAFERLGRP